MEALDFQFATERRPSHRVGWVLFAAGLLFALDLGCSYVAVGREIAQTEFRKAIAARRAPTTLPATASPEELGEARLVVARFATPWPALFDAIESVRLDGISLLAIEPDVGSRAVLISGEARNYLGLLTYVARLREQPTLMRVHLARHEVRETDPRRPLAFSVSAQWRRM